MQTCISENVHREDMNLISRLLKYDKQGQESFDRRFNAYSCTAQVYIWTESDQLSSA